MQTLSKNTKKPLRRALVLALLVLVIGLAWIFSHALADDARPASGEAHNVLSGATRITYFRSEPSRSTEQTETVVLLASLGRPASDFNELGNALTKAGYRTLAVESRGIQSWAGGGFANYQLSDLAGDVRAVIADAGLAQSERVHLVGHAFGNRVVRTFATLYPQQTAALVLVAAGDKTDNMPPNIARALRLSTLGFIPWSLRGDTVSKVFFASGNEVPPYWQQGWSSWGAIGQARAAKAVSNQNFSAGGKGPMLVLQAQDDVIAPPKDAGERLKASYGARVELVPIPHAGHALLPEQPELIAQSIVAFLHQHPAKQGSP